MLTGECRKLKKLKKLKAYNLQLTTYSLQFTAYNYGYLISQSILLS